MKQLIVSILTLLLCLGTVSCQGVELDVNTPEQNPENNNPGNSGSDNNGEDNGGGNTTPTIEPFSIHYTEAVPSEYFQAAAQQGKIELVEYRSKDYTGSMASATKPAYIYLPYGYDPAKKYDIIYLLHGWTGVAQEYFLGRSGSGKTSLVNIFDNLIQKGDTRPFIAVSPTWDTENQSAEWGRSIDEIAAFHSEWLNDLVPAVEGMYSTYAESTDPAGIEASRDHRIFGGFSLGSVTTWWAFEHNFSHIKYFIPISGSSWHFGTYGGANRPKETAEFLADLVSKSKYKDDFYVYVGNGTNDAVYSQPHNQSMAMAEIPEVFNSLNFSYHMKDGGHHDFNAVWEHLYNALPMILPVQKTARTDYYNRKSQISEVMNDPEFGDWGRLIFPVNTGYWSGSTLEDLHLSWYNYIDPDKTVEVVNYMKANAKSVFIDIYTEAEKIADPEKRNVGLFFFKGDENAPFAICNAGGGHVYVGAMHDSFPHALELSKKGYNAFALIYRPDWEPSDQDLARALTYIYDHAKELEVRADGYSLWGGSAGARMAADMGNLTHMHSSTGRNDIPQAAAVIMQYTAYTTVSRQDAPTYANCGKSDGIAPWTTMQNRLNQLSSYGIATEFHAYEGLPHGFGLGTGTVAEGWVEDAVRFWKAQI